MMRIVYYDESGDDGFPEFSSPFFVLSAVYMHYLHWQSNFNRIRDFRRTLREDFGIPVKTEFHTKYFVLNKKPYRSLGLTAEDRLTVVDLFCDLIATLDLQIINVAIVKPRVQSPSYRVLDTAVKYSVQRIENDLNPADQPEAKFLIITDEGRVGATRSTTRRIQRINYIPSRFSGRSYRREITALIEDPLPKDSKESYFIQLADLVALVCYLYVTFETGLATPHGRMPATVNRARVHEWMDRMGPSLNTAAAGDDPYGVKVHPS